MKASSIALLSTASAFAASLFLLKADGRTNDIDPGYSVILATTAWHSVLLWKVALLASITALPLALSAPSKKFSGRIITALLIVMGLGMYVPLRQQTYQDEKVTAQLGGEWSACATYAWGAGKAREVLQTYAINDGTCSAFTASVGDSPSRDALERAIKTFNISSVDRAF